ncbi:hypothetical protein DMUE_5267 [Dictyocoela muelleri]|nr:hypothetical protein DMUE_5267 [Dictyocoela muelleri]
MAMWEHITKRKIKPVSTLATKKRIYIRDKKYYSFLNTISHSNEECRVYKKKNNIMNNNKLYALREPKNTPNIIVMPKKVEDKSFTFMINTGSVENFILEKTKEQKLEQQNL